LKDKIVEISYVNKGILTR